MFLLWVTPPVEWAGWSIPVPLSLWRDTASLQGTWVQYELQGAGSALLPCKTCWQPGAIPSKRSSKLPQDAQPGDLVRTDQTKWSMTIQKSTALLGNEWEIKTLLPLQNYYYAPIFLILHTSLGTSCCKWHATELEKAQTWLSKGKEELLLKK